MATAATRETLGFPAGGKPVLHLMIHSLYGNKEIFLRELISNASDAADKLRFEALSDNALYGSDADLKIRVSFDRKARTVAVSDNGVGMSRDEVVQNIGTIAKSGTREFFESLTGDQASALWARPKPDITEEQYQELYKHVAHDTDAPLAYTHNRVEGRQEYVQLLYIPARAPFDLWDRRERRGLKLYVRRVFIMDDAEQLLPAYLRFVRGVVDSNDLPLNISREILQESRDIEAIRAGCTKRVLGLLEDLSENQKDKYAGFWREFGRVLKEGVGEDFANRERIAKLLRFSSTHTDSEEQTVSLADYIARMKEGQDKIYYVTAETFLAAKNSPHLEIFRKRGIEVLLLSERVDEWLVANLSEYEGKALASVAKGELDLSKLQSDDEKKEEAKQAGGDPAPLAEMKDARRDTGKGLGGLA